MLKPIDRSTERASDESDRRINIVIGPMKTGTTWLHSLRSDEPADKEIFFPVRFFRSWVYNKYVKKQRLLIWPYLVHNPASLHSLLDILSVSGREFRIFFIDRDRGSLIKSFYKYRSRSTVSANAAAAELEVDRAYSVLNDLLKRHPVQVFRCIDPREEDFELIAELAGREVSFVKEASSQAVYSTSGVARFNSRGLGTFYFRVKPFLPYFLRNLRRDRFLKALFFK